MSNIEFFYSEEAMKGRESFQSLFYDWVRECPMLNPITSEDDLLFDSSCYGSLLKDCMRVWATRGFATKQQMINMVENTYDRLNIERRENMDL